MILVSNGIFAWAELVVLAAVMICAAVTDVKTRRIPNRLIVITIIGKLVFLAARMAADYLGSGDGMTLLAGVDLEELVDIASGAAAGILLDIVCLIAAKDGVGFGDMKLIVSTAFFQGFRIFARTLCISSFAVLAAALWLIIYKKKSKEYTVPFAPFLAIGALCSQFISVI